MAIIEKILQLIKKPKVEDAVSEDGATNPNIKIPTELNSSQDETQSSSEANLEAQILDAKIPPDSKENNLTKTLTKISGLLKTDGKKTNPIRLALIPLIGIALWIYLDAPETENSDQSAEEEVSKESPLENKGRRLSKKQEEEAVQPTDKLKVPDQITEQEVSPSKIENEANSDRQDSDITKIEMPPETELDSPRAIAEPVKNASSNKMGSTSSEANLNQAGITPNKETGQAHMGKAPASVDEEEISTEVPTPPEDMGKSEVSDAGQESDEKTEELTAEEKIEESIDLPPTGNQDLLEKLESEILQAQKLKNPPSIPKSDNGTSSDPQIKPLSIPEEDFEYVGRGLVYNCLGRHWACVAQEIYHKCEALHKYSNESSIAHECAPVAVYETVGDCARVQIQKIDDVANPPDSCQ